MEDNELTPAFLDALIQAAAEEVADQKTARPVPNRAEMRRLGSRSGFYRMPRQQPRRTASETHWLARDRSIQAEQSYEAGLQKPGGARQNGKTAWLKQQSEGETA